MPIKIGFDGLILFCCRISFILGYSAEAQKKAVRECMPLFHYHNCIKTFMLY